MKTKLKVNTQVFENFLRVDDLIHCKDRDDLIDTMTELARNGVETDFFYPEGDDPVLIVAKITEV